MLRNLLVTLCVMFCGLVYSTDVLAQQKAEEHKTGTASFYHSKFEGRKTATGEIFDNQLYTCASNHYTMGTYLKVTNIANKKVIYVKVNDRMGHPGRVVDLTERAARDLGFHSRGITKVKIETVPSHEGKSKVLAQMDGSSAGGQKANEL